MATDLQDIKNNKEFVDDTKLMSGFYPAILVSSTKTLPSGSIVLAIVPNEIGSKIGSYTMLRSSKGAEYKPDYHQIIDVGLNQGVLRFEGVVTSLAVTSGSFWCYLYKTR